MQSALTEKLVGSIACAAGGMFCIMLLTMLSLQPGCVHKGVAGVTPLVHGRAVGAAVYIGYCRVADKQGPEFKARVAEIWSNVNKLQSTDTLASDILAVSGAFDKVLTDERLTESERQTLVQLKNMLMSRLDASIAGAVAGNKDALDFLIGVRQGINEMAGLNYMQD